MPRACGLAAAALLLAIPWARADQFDDALLAAKANLTTPEGRSFDEKIEARFEEKHRAPLDECAISAKEEDLVEFTVLMELASNGRPTQILLRPPTAVAICLRWSLREGAFPRPPNPAYWVLATIDPRSRPRAAAPAPTAAAPAPKPPSAGAAREPIIDVHMHALPDGTRLARQGLNEKSHREATLAAMKKHNIVKALVSGTSGTQSFDLLERWRQAAPDLVVPSMGFHLDEGRPDPAALKEALRARHLGAIGEILSQYDGASPDDARLEPYWSLAEELDVPVAIHMGPGPPGLGEKGGLKYRASLGNPLLLEEVLQRHPKLRVYVMHAGWPMLEAMLALLWTYPQVHVDTGVIAWALPRPEFHAYLRRLVEAGFGDRVMFGSDQMEFPEAIDKAIEAIQAADFLTPQQKRDILYNNAVRFLKMDSRPAN